MNVVHCTAHLNQMPAQTPGVRVGNIRVIFAILLDCLFSVLELRLQSVGFLTEAIIYMRFFSVLIDKSFDDCFSQLSCSFRLRRS